MSNLTDGRMNILNLPDEMIMEIFNKISVTDYKTIKQVCTKFEGLLTNWTINEIFEFDSQYKTEEILNIFRTFKPYIKKITLIERNDVNKLLEEMVNMNKLSYLKLKKCTGSGLKKYTGIAPVSGLLLSNIIRNNKNFHAVKIINTKLSYDIFDVFEAVSEKEMSIVCVEPYEYSLVCFMVRRISGYVNKICRKSKRTLVKLKIDLSAFIRDDPNNKLSLKVISKCKNLRVLKLKVHPTGCYRKRSHRIIHSLYELPHICIPIKYELLTISYRRNRNQPQVTSGKLQAKQYKRAGIINNYHYLRRSDIRQYYSNFTHH